MAAAPPMRTMVRREARAVAQPSAGVSVAPRCSRPIDEGTDA
jgi:hypothetical protein